MFKLNLKIAFRSLWKNRTSSLINILGLGIGTAACLLLLVYVYYEWTFDKQGENADQIYTVMTNIPGDDGKIERTFEGSTTALGPLLKEKLPEAKYVVRTNYLKKALIAVGQEGFKRSGKFAEPEFLKLFPYEFLEGNREGALKEPQSIILTASTAKLLFGNSSALNQTVRYQDQEDLRVSAVIKDLPDNISSNLKFDFLMPWAFYEKVDSEAKRVNWDNFSFVTFVYLNKDADLAKVNQTVNRLVSAATQQVNQPFFLFPFGKLHLFGKFENGKSVGGDIEQLQLFIGLALGILMIACINFMNLATAKSEKRAKEVGIKKTIGANRPDLITQFLTESILLSFAGIMLAIALLEISLPLFNQLLGIKMDIAYFNPYTWVGISGIVLATGLIAGSYPAFYLSSFSPIQNLKRKKAFTGKWGVNIRQVLVVGQFCFAIVLIVATFVIYRQIQFVKERPLGVEVNAIVELPQDGALKTKFDLYKDRLLRSGAITSINRSSTKLAHRNSNFLDISWPKMTQKANLTLFNRVVTEYDFIKTHGIKLLQGRDFSPKFASDTSAVLISKSAALTMSMPNPLGEKLRIHSSTYTVIGMFDDYVWDSPYKSNAPMVVLFDKNYTSYVTMRLNNTKALQANVNTITAITKEFNPAYPVELSFLDDVYADLLKKEHTLGILANLFGGLAIFVSCLGLFGLVSFSAEQRTKEFGVRKVLGASILNLMQLLSTSFLKMIGVAIIIASPLSYFAMQKWLLNYEFHTEINWWVIALAAFSTLFLAMVTISVQALKSAKANPVDALKYE